VIDALVEMVRNMSGKDFPAERRARALSPNQSSLMGPGLVEALVLS